MLKKIFFVIAFLLSFSNSLLAADKILITINQFVSHPALDAAKNGIVQTLAKRKISNLSIQEDNAQGNISQSAQIAKHQASLKPRFMVAISTPSAQSNQKAKQKGTALAFVAVTDPFAAGLSKDADTLGVTDAPPIEELVALFPKIFPQLKTVGIVYNPGEINSVKALERLQRAAEKYHFTVKIVPVNASANVKLAAQSLVGSIDILYLPQDNLVISALNTIIDVCKKAKIPVVGNDPSLVEKGLLLALGQDYFQSGVQLGTMIADTLEGKPVRPSIQSLQTQALTVNHVVVKALGITLPSDLPLPKGNAAR